MLADAPGLFSMTTGWPSRFPSSKPIRRTSKSGALPGPKPTTMRSGLEGYASCAKALPPSRPAPKAAAWASTRRRRGWRVPGAISLLPGWQADTASEPAVHEDGLGVHVGRLGADQEERGVRQFPG